MALTSAGELLLGFADEQLTTAERLHAKLGSGRHKTSGQVTVATVEAPLSSFIPQALAEVAATHPDIVVNVLAAGSNDVAALVAENRADLGLVFGPVPRSDVTELVTRPSPLFVMVAPDHPLSARPRCDLTDLLGVRLALPDKSFGIRQEVERAAAEHRVRPELDAGLLTAVAVDDRRLTSTRITLISRLTASGSPALTVVGDALAVAMHGSPRGPRPRPGPAARRPPPVGLVVMRPALRGTRGRMCPWRARRASWPCGHQDESRSRCRAAAATLTGIRPKIRPWKGAIAHQYRWPSSPCGWKIARCV
jgi:DNA-binding transcriptional LysR family regulator